MSTYRDQLRDPRWQRKRLEIMQRDGFACRCCSSTTKTLNVHHNYYEEDSKPWEYENSALFTLCEDCHDKEEERKAHQDKIMPRLLRIGGALNSDMRRIYLGLNEIIGDETDQKGASRIIEAIEDYLKKTGARK